MNVLFLDPTPSMGHKLLLGCASFTNTSMLTLVNRNLPIALKNKIFIYISEDKSNYFHPWGYELPLGCRSSRDTLMMQVSTFLSLKMNHFIIQNIVLFLDPTPSLGGMSDQ